MDYPVWHIAFGGSMLIAVVAIAHVIAAHFAIGGGLVIAVSETLAVRRGDRALRELARRSSLVLILGSTVFGAISGVGIWVVVGLISPAAISALIHNYVWGWAIEWVFFIVELVAALVYFATWDKVTKRTHLMVIWIYFAAAYLSLVIINGILTFMLTPGRWLETRAFWDGFFNPTYWPGLVLRTGIVLLMAVGVMVFPALRAEPEARPRLLRYLGGWLIAGVMVSYGGFRWWEAALPSDIRSLFLGSSPDLATLAHTRSLLLWALAATLLLGAVFLLALPRAMRTVPAILLMVAACTFFGGYERLREGSRKPFLIHDYMLSNGVRLEEIDRLNEEGVLSKARWAAWRVRQHPEELGRQVFVAACSSCHTLHGYQGIDSLASDEPEMNAMILESMHSMSDAFASAAHGNPVNIHALDYPFMLPFAGTEEEMQALAAYLADVVKAAQESREGGAS